MPLKVVSFESTPNPNAVKCVLSGTVSEGSLPFRSAEQAALNPLAAALFAIDGVTGVLLHGEWLTVNKRPDAAWPAVKRGVERALGTQG